ncbi:MAG: hypothetical protein LDL11_07295, partial [Desulfarculus sp.]|nr:hypothetical protein [Desulfarculus sp.]
ALPAAAKPPAATVAPARPKPPDPAPAPAKKPAAKPAEKKKTRTEPAASTGRIRPFRGDSPDPVLNPSTYRRP